MIEANEPSPQKRLFLNKNSDIWKSSQAGYAFELQILSLKQTELLIDYKSEPVGRVRNRTGMNVWFQFTNLASIPFIRLYKATVN